MSVVLHEVRTGDPADAAVALTLDDGPGPWTSDILDVLARLEVQATFFVVGKAVHERPHLVQRALTEGHAFGNHTYDHPQAVEGSVPYGAFDELPLAVQVDQIDRTTQALVDLGAPPPRYFRGPGGCHHAPETLRLVAERGMVVVDWAADTEDWMQPDVLSLDAVRSITRQATHDATSRRPIVLLHDAKSSCEPDHIVSPFRGNTFAAIVHVVAYYRQAGYRFTTPDDVPASNVPATPASSAR